MRDCRRKHVAGMDSSARTLIVDFSSFVCGELHPEMIAVHAPARFAIAERSVTE